MKPYNPYTDHPGAWIISYHQFQCKCDTERCGYCGFGKEASIHNVRGLILIDDIRDPITFERKNE